MIEGTDLLELLPVAVYMTDAEGRITFYNRAAVDLWGYRPELGTARWCGSWRLYWPDGRPMPHDECPMFQTLRGGESVGAEAIAERPDGTRVPFLPYPTLLKDSSGAVVGAINVLVDISERKLAEIESARLASIVTSSDDVIISKTLGGQITSWNEAATRLFGYDASEMIGHPILRIIPLELHQDEAKIIERLRRGERILHYETVRVGKDGRRVDVSITVSPMRDKLGNVIGASKVARDITDRKKRENLDRLLLDELTHRVQNTLATVNAIARQSLRYSKNPGAFMSGFTGRVQALGRAHDLLTQSKMQSANLLELVRGQIRLVAGVDDRVTCSGPMLLLDAQTTVYLALVLHELGSNALKYGALSAANGRVFVTWQIRTAGTRSLFLEWKERNGPRVSVPIERGFGSVLIEQTLHAQGGANFTRYDPEGITAEVTIPLIEQGREAAEAHAVP